MKVSIYDPVTKEHVYYGHPQNAKAQALIAAGNIAVQSPPIESFTHVMGMAATKVSGGAAIEDVAKIQAKEQRKQDRVNKAARLEQLKQQLVAEKGNGAKIREHLDLLIEARFE